MSCYAGHPLLDGEVKCSEGHGDTVSLPCRCGYNTPDAPTMTEAIELKKLHKMECEEKQPQLQQSTRPQVKRAEAKLPRFGDRENREDFSRKKAEFEMYKVRACEGDEAGAAIDLYQSCETPLKKKLMSSKRIQNNPASAGCKVLLDEMEKLSTMGLNKDIERHEFRKMVQEDGETIGDYESRLNSKARYCDFSWCSCCDGSCGTSRGEEETRTQVISGMRDEELQRIFLERSEDFSSLEKVITAIRAKETATSHQETLGSSASRAGLQRRQQTKQQPIRKVGDKEKPRACRPDRFEPSKCTNCGGKTFQESCPANGKLCDKCKKKGHIAAACWGAKKKQNTREVVEEEAEDNAAYVFHTTSREFTRRGADCNSLIWEPRSMSFREKPVVRKKPLEVQVTTLHKINVFSRGYRPPQTPLTQSDRRSYCDRTNCPDTGADVLLGGSACMERLGVTKENLHRNQMKIRAANSEPLEVWGFLPVTLEVKGRKTNEVMYFARGVKHLLVSRGALQRLGCLSRQFPDPIHDLPTTGELVLNGVCSAESKCVFGLDPPQGSAHHSTCAGVKESPGDSPPEAASGCAALRGALAKESPVESFGDEELETETPRRPRLAAPDRPKEIPFPPTLENSDRLENWLKEAFKDSAFNINAAPLAKMSGPPLRIHVKDDARPVIIHRPATIAHHWQDEVKKGLDEDEKLEVIEQVPYGVPSKWQSRMIVVPKGNGRPRRTVDLSPLNRHCLRETHPTESTFHQVSRIPTGQFKTVLDAKNGYHAVELSEEAKELTTFITPWGRYRYRRAPQGFLSAGDAYTRRMDEIYKEVPEKCKVIDDSLIYAETLEEIFWKTFDYIKLGADNGITFNPEKFVFAKKVVDFAGFKITEDGIQPSDKILEDIRKFPAPRTISEARSWFGLTEQVAWSYTIKDTMNGFRELLKPNACKEWQWTQSLNKEFNDAKDEIVRRVKDGVKTFSKERKTCLATDWSKKAVGFLLLQKYCGCDMAKAPVCCQEGWKLIFAGGKMCSPAESRYAPIEGEAMAVAWALERAGVFTLGCPDLLVVTDHKPLVCILGDKALEDIPNPRLVRLKEKTLRWKFQIQHCPGKWNRGPDAFSRMERHADRATIGEMFCDKTDMEGMDMEAYVQELVSVQSASDIPDPEFDLRTKEVFSVETDPAISLTEVSREGAKDKEYSILLQTIKEGFPESEDLCCPLIQKFFKARERLRVLLEDDNEIIVYTDSDSNQRIFIPHSLRARVKQVLHADHRRDLTRVKYRANLHVYWPSLAQDLKLFVEQCTRCQVNAPSQQKEPLVLTPSPNYPFQLVAADFFQVRGQSYLVYVDRFSGWLKIAHFRRGEVSSEQLIKQLRKFFTDFGVPEEVACDQGTNLVSAQMRNWLRSWGVSMRISSAHFAQSNGRAECGVKQAKKIVESNTKTDGSLDTDKFARALLNYHNSCLYPELNKRTIAQTLLGRNLRDSLPAVRSFFEVSRKYLVERKEREEKLAVRTEKAVQSFNTGARPLPPLVVGDMVRIQNQTTTRKIKWDKTGTVVEVLPNRQYSVMVSGSRRLTSRNRRHLRKIPGNSQKVCSPTQPKRGASSGKSSSPSFILVNPNGQNSSSPSDNEITPANISTESAGSNGTQTSPSPSAETPLSEPTGSGSATSPSSPTRVTVDSPPGAASGCAAPRGGSRTTGTGEGESSYKTAEKASPPAQTQRWCNAGEKSPISNPTVGDPPNSDSAGLATTPLRSSSRTRRQTKPWQYGKGWSGRRGW